MFLCRRLASLDTMFSRFNDVLQSAVDVIAPPPTPLQDFQYHWKQVKTFYTPDHIARSTQTPTPTPSSRPGGSASSASDAAATIASTNASHPQPPIKCHLSDTRIPHHLEQMLQLLIAEEQQQLAEPDTPDTSATACPPELSVPSASVAQQQPCLAFLLATRPLDLLSELAATDSPPGARICILAWMRRYLSCMREPRLDRPAVLQPVQRLLQLCRGGRASPYETEEILFAATVAGLVRKEPFLVHLFLPAHQHSAYVVQRLQRPDEKRTQPPRGNPLFETPEPSAADGSRKAGGRSARIVVVLPATGDAEAEAAAGDGRNESAQPLARFACDCNPDEDRLGLLDTILAYVDSADTLVILRACEGALMLATLPTVAATPCEAVRQSLGEFAGRVASRLAELCERIPEDMDTGDIEDCAVSWGLMPRDQCGASADPIEQQLQPHFVGRAQLQEFLGWLDYTNCLAHEACPQMAATLCALVRERLLVGCCEPALVEGNNESAAFQLVLLAKICHQMEARQFGAELATWLVGEAQEAGGDCLLNIVVDMAQDNGDLLLPTLQFVEALIDCCQERILHGMLFRYVNTRGYYDGQAARRMVQTWSDEEEERARLVVSAADEGRGGGSEGAASSVVAAVCRSRTMAPTYILKVINNFLLLLPRQIMSAEVTGTCYEEYVQDASRHYQNWVLRTVDFGWPTEASFPPEADDDDDTEEEVAVASASATTIVSTASASVPAAAPLAANPRCTSHCNDSGICEETFYEGPLLRLLFSHVRNMATHPYEFNLAVIAILSKLALLPHPYLHEILLDPEVPVARGTHTLWSSMQSLARQLLMEVPRREGFQRKVTETGRRLLTNPTMLCESNEDSDPVFEALVVLEEFCKELAAIAFVKYHHATE